VKNSEIIDFAEMVPESAPQVVLCQRVTWFVFQWPFREPRWAGRIALARILFFAYPMYRTGTSKHTFSRIIRR